MSNTTNGRSAERTMKKFILLGLIVLGTASQCPTHAETVLTDSEMKAQTGAVVYSNGQCVQQNWCGGATACDWVPGSGFTECSRTIDLGWRACNGERTPKEQATCTYPTTYNAPCRQRFIGAVRADGDCYCNQADPAGVLVRHNTC